MIVLLLFGIMLQALGFFIAYLAGEMTVSDRPTERDSSGWAILLALLFALAGGVLVRITP